MDLLPPPTDAPAAGGPGAGGSGRGLRRGVGFRSLKLVSVAMDEPLPVDPVGATFGRLANGLTYYVRSNPKPRMRAALSLAVKVGSVLLRSSPPWLRHPPARCFTRPLRAFADGDGVRGGWLVGP